MTAGEREGIKDSINKYVSSNNVHCKHSYIV